MAKTKTPARRKAAPKKPAPPPKKELVKVAPIRNELAVAGFDEKKWDLCKRMYATGATDDEFSLFVHFCKVNDLDPMNKEAWFILRKKKDKDPETGNWEYVRIPVFGASIGGVRKKLEEMSDYMGIRSAVVHAGDKFEADMDSAEFKHKITSLDVKTRGVPIAAWCKIWRKNKPPMLRVLHMIERRQQTPTWDTMPATMLLKCVEMDTIRAAYPKKFGTAYDQSEMEDGGTSPWSAADDKNLIEATPPGEVPKIEDAVKTAVPIGPAPPKTQEATPPGDAFIDENNMNEVRILMQKYRLHGKDMGILIENTWGVKVESLTKIPKPLFKKLVLGFAAVENGGADFLRDSLKIDFPPGKEEPPDPDTPPDPAKVGGSPEEEQPDMFDAEQPGDKDIPF